MDKHRGVTAQSLMLLVPRRGGRKRQHAASRSHDRKTAITTTNPTCAYDSATAWAAACRGGGRAWLSKKASGLVAVKRCLLYEAQ